MPSIATLFACGLTATVLAGCSAPRIPEYPVQSPPLTAHEQKQVQDLVDRFTAPDTLEVPTMQQLHLNQPLPPMSSQGSDQSSSATVPDATTDSSVQQIEHSPSAPSYSPGARKAIEHKVNRQFKSQHERRLELQKKYGIID